MMQSSLAAFASGLEVKKILHVHGSQVLFPTNLKSVGRNIWSHHEANGGINGRTIYFLTS